MKICSADYYKEKMRGSKRRAHQMLVLSYSVSTAIAESCTFRIRHTTIHTETSLTGTGAQGYAQGFANWSHSEDRLVYILAAIGSEGRYDVRMMKASGTENHSITPSYFPTEFLCRNAVFSSDDSRLLFIGQWWE